MRRLTIWITATLAVVALASPTSSTPPAWRAKAGNEGDHGGSSPTAPRAPANSTSIPGSLPRPGRRPGQPDRRGQRRLRARPDPPSGQGHGSRQRHDQDGSPRDK